MDLEDMALDMALATMAECAHLEKSGNMERQKIGSSDFVVNYQFITYFNVHFILKISLYRLIPEKINK